MIKVFIPHIKDKNIYLDEIIRFSDASFSYGNYKEYDKDFDIVNIQFPEAIFNWKLPTKVQLIELEQCMAQWKMNSKIVYTMNDLKRHYNNNIFFEELFKLVQKYADGVVHLGEFSLNKYKTLFSSKCQHQVIFHPIYASLTTNFITQNIQEKIPFDLKDKFIVSSIGGIRSKKEKRLIFKIFKCIPSKNKVLIVPRMNFYFEIPKFIPYRFRKVYKKIVNSIKFFKYRKGNYFTENIFLEYDFLVDLVQKSDILIIPRVENLNSGNLFLGLTFNKNMIVPKVGNLSEIINLFNIPSFDFKKINKKKLNNFFELMQKQPYFDKTNFLENKKQFEPKLIAQQYDYFFSTLKQNE